MLSVVPSEKGNGEPFRIFQVTTKTTKRQLVAKPLHSNSTAMFFFSQQITANSDLMADCCSSYNRVVKTSATLQWRANSTEFCQQLIDGLDDVSFEGGEMLSEVFLAESSRGQQLVERFLLVRFFAATARSAEQSEQAHRVCNFWTRIVLIIGEFSQHELHVDNIHDPCECCTPDPNLSWAVTGGSSPGIFLSDDLQHPSDHVTNSGLRRLGGNHSPPLFPDYFHQIP